MSNEGDAEAEANTSETLRIQLEEYKVQINDLSGRMRSKDSQIHAMQLFMDRLNESHKKELAALELEVQTNQSDSEYSQNILQEKNRKLEIDLSAFAEIENERNKLKDRVNQLNEDFEKQSMKYAKLLHETKSDAFAHRMQLENAFRKEVKAINDKYQQEAFRGAKQEMKEALVQKSALEEELYIRKTGIEAVLHQNDKISASLKKMRMGHELLKNENDVLMKDYKRLKKKNLDQERRLKEQHARNLELEKKLNDATTKRKPKDDAKLSKDLATYKTLLAKERQAKEKWKARAFQASDQLMTGAVSISQFPQLNVPKTGSTDRSLHSGGTKSAGSSKSIEFDKYVNISSIWSSNAEVDRESNASIDSGILVHSTSAPVLKTKKKKAAKRHFF